jgi:protein O-mannosyl-transferase
MTAGLRALFITLILAVVAWTTREIPGFGFLPQVDDDVNIFLNPNLGAPDAARLHWMATDFTYVHRYMPLGWLGFSLVYAAAGLNPAAFHVAGIALHAANSILLLLLLEHLLRRFAPAASRRDRVVAAGVATLLWALHPLRVETTAWCSGLLYAQAGFFALVCVLARVEELRARSAGRAGRGDAWLAMGWLAYAASLLTYPLALFLPFALIILDACWTAGRVLVPRQRAALWAGAAVLAATALAGLALTVHARATATDWMRAPTLAEFGPLARLLQAAYVAVVYLWRTAAPVDLGWMPTTLLDAGSPGALGWVAAAVLLGGIAWTWARRRAAPAVAACGLAYLVLLVPNLGLSEHPHSIADRYLYITGIVFSVALAVGLVRIRSRALFGGAVAGCLSPSTVLPVANRRQARTWGSPAAFEAKMMAVPEPELRHITAARAGKLRFLRGEVRDGRAQVWDELQRAPGVGGVQLTWREIAPRSPLSPEVASRPLEEWPVAPYALIELQLARGQLAEGRSYDAVQHLTAAIQMAPEFSEARFRRGILFCAYGRLPEALHDWLQVAQHPAGAGGELAFFTDSLRKAYLAAGDEGSAAALERVRPPAGSHRDG